MAGIVAPYNDDQIVLPFLTMTIIINITETVELHDLWSFAFQEGIKKNKLNVYIPENKVINIKQNWM